MKYKIGILIIVIIAAVGIGTKLIPNKELESQIATDKAILIFVESRLENPNLDEDTRFNLQAQAYAARIRIAKAK